MITDTEATYVWYYVWGNANFTCKKVYNSQQDTLPASPLFKWMWKSKVQNKHKFFFRLLLRDRLNTRNILRRKHMAMDCYNCVQCVENCEETLWHFFFDCHFSLLDFLGITWDTSLQPPEMILRAREDFRSCIFREVLIIACWSIWCHGNSIIFYNGTLSFMRWRNFFERKMNPVALRVKPEFSNKITNWLSSLQFFFCNFSFWAWGLVHVHIPFTIYIKKMGSPADFPQKYFVKKCTS